MTIKKKQPKKTLPDAPSENQGWDMSKPPIEQNNAQGAELRKNRNSKVSVPEDGMGERIRARREERNLTQEALSILTKYPEIDPEGRGLSRPSIVGYEQGKNLPDARGIRLLATALDVTPSWLVVGKYDEGNPKEDPKQALIDALDKYTARRNYELQIPDMFREISGQKKLEGLDPMYRASLEMKASEEARLETQKRNRPPT